MKNIVGIIILIAFTNAFSNCKNSSNTNISNTDTTKFYSIKSFFEGEKHFLDSMPYYIYMVTTNHEGKKDSTDCSKATFDSIALQFASKDIVANGLKKQYTETTFKDLSTNSITLHYQANDKKLDVQTIDVLLNEETSQVNRIFIKTFKTTSDSTISYNYSWKAGKSCLITRSVHYPALNKTSNTSYFINWHDSQHP